MSFDESINDLPTNVVSFRDGSSMTLGPGTEFDDFRVLEKLGRGGLGEVWKARDLTGNRDVALKFVPRDIQFHEEEMERVRETFQTIHALHHQHICPTLALRRHPDFGSYLMMAFVDGVPLSFYLRQVKKVPLIRALEILRPVAEALDYAHSRNVIHRDIKPGNVMLVFGKNPDGSMNFDQLRDVQLIDFGLASEFRQSMTRVSQVRMSTSGTRPYMSPEQFQGKGQDARTDQYSLGTLAYELLCGKLPFQAEDDFVLFNCIMNVQPEPLKDQPDWVNTALLQAMAKDRTVRFSSCVKFLTALEGKEAEKVKTARLEEERRRLEREPMEIQPGIHAGERATRRINGVKYAFRWCPPGTFTMGSPAGIPQTVEEGFIFRRTETHWIGGEEGRSNDEKQHQVTLTQGFWILETQVTQEMWASVMGKNPSYFKGYQNPVENVSWDSCQEFCRKLSEKSGLKVSLPTEAQWEYACRSGTTGAYAGDLDAMSWHHGNCRSHQPTGLKKPNAWGLYDMHGNVSEWCLDWYDENYYAKSPATNPAGPKNGQSRVVRGGSWCLYPGYCRSAYRSYRMPGKQSNVLGFRVVVINSGK